MSHHGAATDAMKTTVFDKEPLSRSISKWRAAAKKYKVACMSHAQTHEPEGVMTREEFLAWVDQQPTGRFERIDGIVVAMAPARASHNRRKAAARDALRRAVQDAGLSAC